MKTIVDENTGELKEVPETNDLVLTELEESGVINDHVLQLYENLATAKQQIEMYEHSAKEKIKEVFKKYNIKSFSNQYITISLVKESMQQRVDTEHLKQDGLYDKYSKLVPVAESVRIKVKD